jgi:hypothetical protein
MSARWAAATLLGLALLMTACGRTHLLPRPLDGGRHHPGPDAAPETVLDATQPLACGPFNPCGGPVSGAWTVESVCLPDQPIPGCLGAKVGFTDVTPRGDFLFAPDGTYVSTLSLRAALTVTIPLSCAAQQAGVPVGLLNCVLLGAALQMAQAPPGSGLTAATCTGFEVCNCSLTFASPPATESGHYSVSGHSLLLDGSGTGQVQALDYCAVDPALLLKTQLPAPLMGLLDVELALRRLR